jgi:hypothetical protein
MQFLGRKHEKNKLGETKAMDSVACDFAPRRERARYAVARMMTGLKRSEKWLAKQTAYLSG